MYINIFRVLINVTLCVLVPCRGRRSPRSRRTQPGPGSLPDTDLDRLLTDHSATYRKYPGLNNVAYMVRQTPLGLRFLSFYSIYSFYCTPMVIQLFLVIHLQGKPCVTGRRRNPGHCKCKGAKSG